MPVIKSGSSSFKPYARIMSIIGDQLITDKLVALVEIVKNSFDADARNVTIKFDNWMAKPSKSLPLLEPSIEIIDNGSGMNEDVLLNVFLNPGTPNKLLQKKEDRKTPILHRTMQGEKGIGRFAINKLGQSVTIYSKTCTDPEIQLNINFEEYDSEEKNNIKDYKLLSDIKNEYVINEPPSVIKEGAGTIIKIKKLKQTWTTRDFDALVSSLQKLVAPPDILREKYCYDNYQVISDFEFSLEINGVEYKKPDDLWRQVLDIAPFKMIGDISSEGVLSYKYFASEPFPSRKVDKSILLTDVKKLLFNSPILKQRFAGIYDDEKIDEDNTDNEYRNAVIPDSTDEANGEHFRTPQQGPISFSFYVYDYRKGIPQILNKTQKDFVDSHSVFVFRDGIRVYPFGEKGYDWLELSVRRAREKAGDYYGIAQIIGFVYITGKDNPKLKDTTSRYGLMDIDGAYNDLQALVLGTLNAMKTESDIDIKKSDIVKERNLSSTGAKLETAYNSLTKEISKSGNQKLIESVNEFKNTFDKNSSLLKERLENYEDLAGIGLAVEKSSHDAVMILRKTFGTVEDLRTKVRNEGALTNDINELIEELKTNIDIVYNEMQVIQPLFRISRRTQTTVDVQETVDKAIRYFRHELSPKIKTSTRIIGGPLEIVSNQGLLLQVLINLIDNSVYWLKEKSNKEKEIIIVINGNNKNIIVADNGIGISEDLSEIVFEPFFSRKDAGRGLGLHITRELLARIGAGIKLVYSGPNHILSGANFLIQFESE